MNNLVDDICYDEVAYQKFPQYRQWFNKLYVADTFGYICGPGGYPVPKADTYVVRPTYNLRGFSINASKMYINPEDVHIVPPGYFWVEVFKGNHYTLDYTKIDNKFQQINCYVGDNDPEDLYRFYSWKKSNYHFTLPKQLEELDVKWLNIEVIGDKIVEVHLRHGMDSYMEYEELIPVWEGDKKEKDGYTFIEKVYDGEGWFKIKRLGYLVK